MHRHVLWIPCLLLLLGVSHAEDDVVWRDLPTAESQGKAVLAAVEGSKPEQLATLAAAHPVDPWLVAEDLVLQGKSEAAVAYARAAQAVHGKDVEALPAYLEARGTQPKDALQRTAWRRFMDPGARPGVEEQLELTASAAPEQQTVASLELRRRRALALAARDQRTEGQALLRGIIATAKKLRWHRGAVTALYDLAGSARAVRDVETDEAAIDEIRALAAVRARPQADAVALHSRALFLKDAKKDFRGSIALQEQELAIWEELDEKPHISGTRINLGIAHLEAADYAKGLAHLERGLALAREIGHRQWAANALLSMGVAHMRQNHLDTALGLYEQALVLQEAGGDQGGIGTAHMNIAQIHWRRRDLEKALEHSTKAADAYERAGRPDRGARTYEGLGTFLTMRGDYAEAERMQVRAIELGEKARDAELVARARSLHATCLHLLGKQDAALAEIDLSIEGFEALGQGSNADEARSIKGDVLNGFQRHEAALALLETVRKRQEETHDTKGLCKTLGRLGSTHSKLGDVERAAELLQKGIDVARSVGEMDTLATATVNLGAVLAQLGRLDEALQTYDQAIQLAGALGRAGLVRTARVGKAGVYLTQGKRREALQIYRLMLGEARRAGDRAREAATLGHIAHLQSLAGQNAKALTTLARSRELYEAAGSGRRVAETDCSIGNLYHQLGRHAKALSTLEDARDRLRRLEAEDAVARAEGLIANVYEHLGELEKALACQERALAAHKRSGNRLEIARATIHLGNVHHGQGRLDEALAAYTAGRDMMRELGNAHFEAVAIGNIGNVQVSKGEFEAAEASLQEAIAMHTRLEHTHGLPAVHYALGMLRVQQGRFDDAFAHFEQAASIANSARSAHFEVGALTRMAALLLAQKKPQEALATAERALVASETLLGGLADAEGVTARQRLSDLFGIGMIAATKAENVDAAIRFLERGRAGSLLDALDQRDAIRWSRASLPEALLQLEATARETEAAALRAYERARRRGQLAGIRQTSSVLEQARERQREIAARIQRAVKQEDGSLFLPRRRTRRDLESSLEPHEALVLYAFTKPMALAVVVRHDGSRIVELGEKEPVVQACKALDLAARDQDASAATAAARKLLIEPLALAEDITQVIVSPDGVLSYVPFAVLFRQTVALTPSGTTHAILREDAYPAGEGILSLGDPVYTGEGSSPRRSPRGVALAALPATRAEAEGIGTTVLLGAKASESGLKAALPKEGRLRAVHFACHGLVDETRPALSSLALSQDEESDGFLTALEIRRMDIPADLAVLSACETGRGRVVGGEGLVGMSRAFMFAGAPRVICSLWKVDDEATQALMLEFYRRWSPKDGSKGLPAAEALRAAQEHVRSQPKWKHPYYWAAWVLWGLPE